jgi:hypothetical protein
MLTKKKALSTQASVVHKSANDFPMNQIERLDDIKTYHNRYDDDEFTDNNNIPALVSDGSSSDISSDVEDSDDNDEDFDVTQSNLINEEQVDSLIFKSDGSNKVIDIDVFGIDVTEGGNHDHNHPHLKHKHGTSPWRNMNANLMKVNTFIIRERIDKYRHLISLTAEAARKSLKRRIKTVMMLGSLQWMWVKLLGVSRKEVNAATTEPKSQKVGRDAEYMHALLNHRSPAVINLSSRHSKIL